MADQIDKNEREKIWIAMSEVFVDNDIFYDEVVRALCIYPICLLKRIFFDEVLPVCGKNLLSPVPSIWTGFEPASLVAEIREMIRRKDQSIMSKIHYHATRTYYRLRLSYVWPDLEARLTL